MHINDGLLFMFDGLFQVCWSTDRSDDRHQCGRSNWRPGTHQSTFSFFLCRSFIVVLVNVNSIVNDLKFTMPHHCKAQLPTNFERVVFNCCKIVLLQNRQVLKYNQDNLIRSLITLFALQPIQDIVLVLCKPLNIASGPLNGLFQCQGSRAETNICIVILEGSQLWQISTTKKVRVKVTCNNLQSNAMFELYTRRHKSQENDKFTMS